MDGILQFLQSPIGQIVIVVAVALLFGKNPALLDWILTTLKIQKPVTPVEEQKLAAIKVADLEETEDKPDRNDAFIAANVLLEYFKNTEQGGHKEGIDSAKKCGQCLFH